MGSERFMTCRSTPSVVLSDSGTNFVGAEKEVLLCVGSWNRQAPSLLVHNGIEWKCNPAGGSWER